jgi:hypothetical protein
MYIYVYLLRGHLRPGAIIRAVLCQRLGAEVVLPSHAPRHQWGKLRAHALNTARHLAVQPWSPVPVKVCL